MTVNETQPTEKVRFEVQERYASSVFSRARAWSVAEYAKRGETSRELVFKTAPEAKRERSAMKRRSAKYRWGAEYRVVKVVTTYEVIA